MYPDKKKKRNQSSDLPLLSCFLERLCLTVSLSTYESSDKAPTCTTGAKTFPSWFSDYLYYDWSMWVTKQTQKGSTLVASILHSETRIINWFLRNAFGRARSNPWRVAQLANWHGCAQSTDYVRLIRSYRRRRISWPPWIPIKPLND